MKKSLRVISFFITMMFCNLAHAQQDIITLKKIEVYGQQHTSNVTFYKNAPVSIKVSYSVLKQTASHANLASSAYFVADMATGAPYQIHVHSGPGFPVNYGQSGDYEFYTQVQNASMLIKSYNSGNLYLRLTSSAGGVMAYSNKFTSSFSDPTVTNNTISGGGNVGYMETAPTLFGTNVTVMPSGEYEYTWQRINPNGTEWYNVSVNGNPVKTKDYTPPPAQNKYNHKLRRAVWTKHYGTFYSNEIEMKVGIGNNVIEQKPISATRSLYLDGSFPQGGSGTFSYKWQEKINSVWTDIPNETTYKLMLPVTVATTTPKYYRRIVSSAGTSDHSSNEIEIIPGIYGNVIYKSQNMGAVYEGDKLMPGQVPQMNILQTSYSGQYYSTENPMSYQWQKKEAGGAWEDIAGAVSEIYTVNNPIYVTTEYRRKNSTPNLGDHYSNILSYVISSLPAITGNTIAFDAGNVQNILGSIPTGGDGNFEYYWVVDITPDESIGPMPSLISTQNSTIDALASTHPLGMDEFYFARYAISDGVWHKSNIIKYSYTNGVLLKQALQSKNAMKSQNATEKKILVVENKGEVLFNFKNYNKDNVQIYLIGLNGMQSEKIITTTIDNDNFMSSWRIPVSYLPGVYLYKIIFNNGEVKNGKVVLKK